VKSKLVEATAPDAGSPNWGKFLVAQFDEDEWGRVSDVSGRPLVASQGWSREHALVLDLSTGQGALFCVRPGGVPELDLRKLQLHLCPLFRVFLQWLYVQDLSDVDVLPAHVDLSDVA
jgi:hypothetical protein